MRRALTTTLLSVAMCLVGIASVLAQEALLPTQCATMEEYEKTTGKKIVKFSEAPVLRIKVAAGELPPVEERLPEEPAVVLPVEEIGQYGGTWHRVWGGEADAWNAYRIIWQHIVKWNRDAGKVVPNVFKSWEISKDGKVYTFHLRKGLKWSDGVLFTADDVMFWYEDVLLNKELTPVFPSWLTVDGEPVKVEKVDDYTVRFKFAKPYGLFLFQIDYGDRGDTFIPKHYMKKFHPRYTPMDKLKKMAKEEGFEHWYQLFGQKRGNWYIHNPEHPTIFAWKVTVPSPATRVVFERNPYFWKVDPEGNQLPYIDRIVFDLAESAEMINFKAMTGEIDMQGRGLDITNYTLFMKNREKGDYRVIMVPDKGIGAKTMICLNQNCKDPVLRKIIQDDRFRFALSLAINREEINELIYSGLGKPRQASFVKGTPYYSEEWEKAYAEYDPERANAFLDEMGLRWDKDHEYRLRPDGKTLSLTVELTEGWADALSLIKEYWEAVGVKTNLKVEDRSLLFTRTPASEHEVCVWSMASNLLSTASGCILPLYANVVHWAPEYGRWHATEGKAGQKPTGDIAKAIELWDKLVVTVDEEERDRLAREIVRLEAKHIWMIGDAAEIPYVIIAKNNFRNLATIGSCETSPENFEAEQFFFKK